MAEKIKTRIQNKHDTPTNWSKATSFKPLPGEIIIYDTDSANDCPRMKVGDGKTTVDNLPFLSSEAFKEGNLEWGGKNHQGDFGPLDAALDTRLGTNRFALSNPAGISVQYSRNAGVSWTDYGLSDVHKARLVTTKTDILVGKSDATNNANKNGTNYMLRVVLDAQVLPLYTELNKFILDISTNGFSKSWCTIEAAKAGTSTWEILASQIEISGFPGYNVINIPAITVGANSSNYSRIRFTFGGTGNSSVTTTGLIVHSIFGYGGHGWTTPSDLAKRGTIYNYEVTNVDTSGNPVIKTTFPNTVEATNFVGNLSGTAASATMAEHATSATSAGSAETASKDADGNLITNTYVKKSNIEDELEKLISCGTEDPDASTSGLFYFKY